MSKVNSDSSFNYLFTSSLKINLNLPANCCPDEDRFKQISKNNDNVITIIVVDTAAHLCRCRCNYEIELSIDNLPGDEYIFICNYEDSNYYNENILRKF